MHAVPLFPFGIILGRLHDHRVITQLDEAVVRSTVRRHTKGLTNRLCPKEVSLGLH